MCVFENLDRKESREQRMENGERRMGLGIEFVVVNQSAI